MGGTDKMPWAFSFPRAPCSPVLLLGMGLGGRVQCSVLHPGLVRLHQDSTGWIRVENRSSCPSWGAQPAVLLFSLSLPIVLKARGQARK